MILGEVKDESIGYWNDEGCLISAISDTVEKVGLPCGDYMDKQKLSDMYFNEEIQVDDLFDALVETTNALLEIRTYINQYEER